MVSLHFEVKSPDVQYTSNSIIAKYTYCGNNVCIGSGHPVVIPYQWDYSFKTKRHVGRVGLMLVGWGGNNGSTLTASIYANKNKIEWHTKDGIQYPDYKGSITQSSTVRLGCTDDGQEVHMPMKDILPTLNPDKLIIGGWDINGADLKIAMQRAKVLHINLQRKIGDYMATQVPLPSIYYSDFQANNQHERANNVITGSRPNIDQLRQLRSDIRQFKTMHNMDTVIVIWTASTERMCNVTHGVHDTEDNFMHAIENGHTEIAPSQMFAAAAILEKCSFINGSPQNTFIPALVQMAYRHKVFIGGDDFKSGQTKIKSVLVDFLISAGIKVESIVSYNHLGNNDGKNLSAPEQFRSKEISKSNLINTIVQTNSILYEPGEIPDHTVVIKYVPYVGDSKRAMDEYISSIFMGGKSTIMVYNICEDSLLAAPLIIDLVVLTELMERITYMTNGMASYERMDSVLSILSYLFKAPKVPQGSPVINALHSQRMCIENILRACVGLQPDNQMLLKFKTSNPFITLHQSL